jgi:hypothetical protein
LVRIIAEAAMRNIFTILAVSAAAAIPAVASAAPADILTANEAASGGVAWSGKATLKTIYAYSGQGLTGKSQSLSDLTNGRWADSYEIGPTSGADGFDGVVAWDKDPSGTVKLEQGGDARELAVNEGYRRANMWWRADRGGAAIVDDGQKSAGGETYDVLTVTPKDGKPFDAWFGAKTHLLERTVEVQSQLTVTTTLSDYRAFNGAELAGKAIIDTGQGEKYLQTMTLTKALFLPVQAPAAYAAPKVTVADFSIAGGGYETSVPFGLINNHIYANVIINGHGPLFVIFDTGGHNLLMPDEAKALNLSVVGQMAGSGAGEGVIDMGLTKVSSLSIGNATVRDQPFIVTPFYTREVEGIDEKGMVGFETFRRFVTRIDYGNRTVTLIDPNSFNPADAGTPIPLVFDGDNPEVDGSFEGIPAKFDIDTGSRSELTLTKPFVEQFHLQAKHPHCVDAVDGWGVGGPSRSCVTRGAMLTIGPVRVANVVTGFATQNKGAFAAASYQGNIGTGFLKRFAVTFDYGHSIMYLKPAAHTSDDIGTYDRAGFWINGSANGFKVVDVTPHTPGDEAGIKVDDEIVAVDGKPASSIHVYDLRKQLRDEPPGTVVTFTVQRGNEQKTIAVTLRDLI